MAKGGRCFDHPEGEVCVMQSAATLLGVIQDRGSRGLPLERVYRHLFNRELYLQAFARIASNEGALTPGATAETADGMSLGDIDAIIEALRFERYRWTPARRVYIEKKNSNVSLSAFPIGREPLQARRALHAATPSVGRPRGPGWPPASPASRREPPRQTSSGGHR